MGISGCLFDNKKTLKFSILSNRNINRAQCQAVGINIKEKTTNSEKTKIETPVLKTVSKRYTLEDKKMENAKENKQKN